MGTFGVRVDVGDVTGERWESIDALVDTGATYAMIPAPLLRRLGLKPYTRDVFSLADGRYVEHDIGHGWTDGRSSRSWSSAKLWQSRSSEPTRWKA